MKLTEVSRAMIFNVSRKVYDTDQNLSLNKVRTRAVVNSDDYLLNYH